MKRSQIVCQSNDSFQEEDNGEEKISLLTPYEYGRKRKAQDQNERKTKRTKTSTPGEYIRANSLTLSGRRGTKSNNSATSKEDKTQKG